MTSARQAILEVAARHFADHGFSGASLREIMRDAKVNPASAHYHFGSKEAVYRATIATYLTRLGEERIAFLKQWEPSASSTPQQRMEQLIRAYIEPHIRLCEEPEARHYVRLLARFITENEQVTEAIYTEFLSSVRGAYLRALNAIAPQIPESTLSRLFSFMVTLMVTAPADTSYESLTGTSPWPNKSDVLINQLVSFIAAGFADAAASYAHRPQSGKSAIGVKPNTVRSEAVVRKKGSKKARK